MPDLIESLRAATREQHAELDQHVLALSDVERYRAFLRGSFAALAPLEQALVPWLDEQSRVARGPLIQADLSDLGAEPAAAMANDSPPIDSAARAWGARYVIEGSALGGVHLARGVQQALGGSTPVRYLTVHGSELGSRWRAFTSALNAWGQTATPAEKSAACDTAGAVFAWYREAFARTGALSLGS